MRFGRLIATGVLVAVAVIGGGSAARAESPSPTSSANPCFLTLKFAGAIYFDTDQSVPLTEVGPVVGETEPNPTHCGLPDRLSVHRHNGHVSTQEVVYVLPGTEKPELFRSGGETGFPMQNLLRWVVLTLVLGILIFAVVPVMYAHMRQPPVEVAGPEDADV